MDTYLKKPLFPVFFATSLFLAFSFSLHAQSSEGLEAYWSFDDDSSWQIPDKSGNGHFLQHEGVRWTSGISGSCLSFDGQNDLVSNFSFTTKLSEMNQISIGMWIKPDNVEPYQFLAGKNGVNFGGMSYQAILEKGHWSFQLRGANTRRFDIHSRSEHTITPNEWHYLVAVYSMDSLKMYTDGMLSYSAKSIGAPIAKTKTPFCVGYVETRQGKDHFYSGSMDEIRVYSRALSENEIAQYYRQFPRNSVKLIPYEPDPTTERRPKLEWFPVIGARNYKIVIGTEPDLYRPSIIEYTGNKTSFIPETDLPAGTIYWKVSSNLDYSEYSETDDFEILEVKSLVFISPKSGEETTDRWPLFNWHRLKDVSSYTLKIGTSKNFNAPVIYEVIEAPKTKYLPTAPLPYGKVYWQVSCNDGTKDYEVIDSLIVLPFTDPPKLIAPEELATVSEADSLIWTKVPDPSSAVSYELQLSNVDNFSFATFFYSDTVEDTVIALSSLTNQIPMNKQLFWRVRAINKRGMKTPFSGIGSFSIQTVNVMSALKANTINELYSLRHSKGKGIAVTFSTRIPQTVSVALMDINGRCIDTHSLNPSDASTFYLGENVTGLATGLYYIAIKTGNQTHVRRIPLMK